MPAYSPAEIHTLFRTAFNLGDVEALIALYENAILVVDGNSVSGRENIRKVLESILLRRGRMTLETRSVEAARPCSATWSLGSRACHRNGI
jgi:ketosteroid isomerase-like protein